MVNKTYIKYIIDGLGKYEETILSGYEEGEYFYFGNARSAKVFVDKVVLGFDDNSEFVLPNMSNTVEIKKGEEITPFLMVKPSPKFKIIISDIREEEKRCYI
jgi:hypothetical protein